MRSMTGGTLTLQTLGPAFGRYVELLQGAWSDRPISDRAEMCRQAMEGLFRAEDPSWQSAVEQVAAAEKPVELYGDPILGFIQMAHPYRAGHASAPHGHGAGGWVVYGVGRGRVEIATYEVGGGSPPLRVVRSEVLAAGEARVYLPGELHSTRMVEGEGPGDTAVVLRLLSEDLSKLDRIRYEWQDVAPAG